ELAAVGDEARAQGIRLTMHPASFVRLESEDETLARRAQQELTLAALLLDAMGLDEEGVLVVHVDAPRVEGVCARDRQVARLGRAGGGLPAGVGARLVLETGDGSAVLIACLWVQRRTGRPIVLDVLHHRCNNPDRIPMADALTLALASWMPGVRPKVHLSSPR